MRDCRELVKLLAVRVARCGVRGARCGVRGARCEVRGARGETSMLYMVYCVVPLEGTVVVVRDSPSERIHGDLCRSSP